MTITQPELEDAFRELAERTGNGNSYFPDLARNIFEYVGRQRLATTTEIPQPSFPHHAYGVGTSWFGDDGGVIAQGHIPDLRFVATCNHLARTEAGLVNIWDDRTVSLDDTLPSVRRCWAVPIDPANLSSDYDWAVSYVTEQTPGAIAVTVLTP